MPRINFFVFTIALSFILFYPSCNGNGESSIEARVTFRVDMGNEIVSNNGVHIAGTMESPNGSIEEMLDSDDDGIYLSLIHISEPTRLGMISYAVFCLKK